MRVIGGEWRGRAIRAPELASVRPTSDRVREAVFDLCEARGLVEGAEVLDLFAGSGALGIEALSRGAASCVFVEADRRAARVIEANLEKLGLARAPRARVVVADALGYAAGAAHRFDLAFVDPPYAFAEWPALLAVLPAEVAVLEHGGPLGGTGPFESLREYRYGGTLVTLVARHPTEKDPA